MSLASEDGAQTLNSERRGQKALLPHKQTFPPNRILNYNAQRGVRRSFGFYLQEKMLCLFRPPA